MAAAGKELLACLKKRDLLNDENADQALLIAEGDVFFAAGRLVDALEFFGKADHREGLERVLSEALEEGDFFLAGNAARKLGRHLSSEQLVRLGDKAVEKGKYRFALEAFTRAEEPDKAEKVRQLIAGHDSVP